MLSSIPKNVPRWKTVWDEGNPPWRGRVLGWGRDRAGWGGVSDNSRQLNIDDQRQCKRDLPAV